MSLACRRRPLLPPARARPPPRLIVRYSVLRSTLADPASLSRPQHILDLATCRVGWATVQSCLRGPMWTCHSLRRVRGGDAHGTELPVLVS
ncbi:uncharacterized protein K452DRAFT_53584 [Aplosporella prunicola CBS 121167]|uniref:Uncharacterized protein n=1 Tax=Aplosporella prunicola CBS 121167 TaxID=1176127 RepID=A0A6A6B800_9PEZI|nr:uncharacterized protein K452DRAFT_53584 [Aplosporella prunicola CBS 121167]KAF2140269.1 hypothetical protein K452DRAFT_53584 [Aplosporella prunicola CBS 121167]